VPWYSAASHYYGTYTHQYAWVVSAAFLSGLAPGVVEFFLWAALLALVAFTTHHFDLKNHHKSVEERTHENSKAVKETSLGSGAKAGVARLSAYFLFLSVNLTLVVIANVAFIYVALNGSNQSLLLAQVLLSLWKFGWNSFGVPFLIDVISARLMAVNTSAGFFRVQAFVGLFNNIAIPCLVVAVQSPSCFRDLLYPPDDVESSYSVVNCDVFQFSVADPWHIACNANYPTPAQSYFTPQFSYSYQCSSSFATYYSATMVYFALAAAVLVPAVRLLLYWVVSHTTAGSTLNTWCSAALSSLWRVPLQPAEHHGEEIRRRGSTYLNGNNLLMNLTVYLGILLSFGVVFPPVALAMCAAMLSTAYQTRLAVGRLLCNAREMGAQHVVEAVEQDCKGVASQEKLWSVIMMAMVFACCFYALFIFDTVGDAEGFAGACWVLALWVVAPICAAICSWCTRPSARIVETSPVLADHSVELAEGVAAGRPFAEEGFEDSTVNALHA
jgi:hypothetical protein